MSKGKVASSTKENVNYGTDRYIAKTFRVVTLKKNKKKTNKPQTNKKLRTAPHIQT